MCKSNQYFSEIMEGISKIDGAEIEIQIGAFSFFTSCTVLYFIGQVNLFLINIKTQDIRLVCFFHSSLSIVTEDF